MKKLVAAILLAAPLFAGANTTVADAGKVTVIAKGHDVRQVLTDVFAQAKKSCVIQHNIQCPLYLTLENTPFDQALAIICKQANLVADLDKDVYYIHPPVHRPAPVAVAEPTQPAPPAGKLPANVLSHRVTTRLAKATLRTVLDALGKQTGVTIELDPQVPAYKLDAFLINTSLKYALDQVTKAANLSYKFTDHQTILVSALESKVALTQ